MRLLSTIDKVLASLPKKLQIEMLEAMAEERRRWDEGRFTGEERMLLNIATKAGESAARIRDEILIKCLIMRSSRASGIKPPSDN